MIGIPSSFAFLFLEDAELMSLLIRHTVFFVTLPVTLPPFASMASFMASRLSYRVRLPVITKLLPFNSPSSACSRFKYARRGRPLPEPRRLSRHRIKRAEAGRLRRVVMFLFREEALPPLPPAEHHDPALPCISKGARHILPDGVRTYFHPPIRRPVLPSPLRASLQASTPSTAYHLCQAQSFWPCRT